MTVALYLSEPQRLEHGARFEVTIREAVSGRLAGTFQLILTGDGGREYRDADGNPFPAGLSYDGILSLVCGRERPSWPHD